MLQKQPDYYWARFHFAFAPTERGIAGATEKLLQRCNSLPCDPSSLPFQPPLRFYLIPQLHEHLSRLAWTRLLSIESVEYEEKGKYPQWVFKIHDRIFATLQRCMPTQLTLCTFHYHSTQFDEYYSFASAYPSKGWNFFDQFSATQEMLHILMRKQFIPIDYSTVLIPE